MTKLKDIAKVIRSKNAGALFFTLDVMFEEEATFRSLQEKKELTSERVSSLYGLSADIVRVIEYPPAYAFKITFPRQYKSGDPEDTDIYGAQQHAPLMDLEVSI